MNFWELSVRRIEKKYKVIYKHGPSTIAMFFAGIAIISWVSVILLSGYPAFQYIYYTLRPATSDSLARLLYQTISETSIAQAQEHQPSLKQLTLPSLDSSLPQGHYLSIPSIGVDSVIWEENAATYETALRKGVWRVPDLGEPHTDIPMMLVAHRFGYVAWTNEYRTKNSFYNLPKLRVGDEFEVLWDQRRFKYKVEAIGEGEKVDNYNYDIILYTCKFLVSPVRIFVYANRVN